MDLETRESLIARLPNHCDVGAWDEFVELYQPLIYGIGRRHGLQRADANDLVQNVLIAVSESIDRFSVDAQRGRFRTWLFRVARNQALLHMRKLKNHAVVGGDQTQHNVLESQPAADPASREFLAAFRRRAFRWAARRVRGSVKADTWEAFSRTAIDGQSPQKVADELGVDIGTIYLSRSRVMAKLRKLVENVSCETEFPSDDGLEATR